MLAFRDFHLNHKYVVLLLMFKVGWKSLQHLLLQLRPSSDEHTKMITRFIKYCLVLSSVFSVFGTSDETRVA